MEAMLFEDFMIGEVLAHQSSTKNIHDWMDLLGMIDKLIEEINIQTLSKRGRLAYGMMVIGARQTELFGAVFESILEWDHIGGCFWVCAEELYRHYAISCLTRIVESNSVSEPNTINLLSHTIQNLFPTGKKWSRNEILCERLDSLGTEIASLLNSSHRRLRHRFDEYLIKTPLELFVPWYLKWATKHIAPKSNQIPKPCSLFMAPVKIEKQSIDRVSLLKCHQSTHSMITCLNAHELPGKIEPVPLSMNKEINAGKRAIEVNSSDITLLGVNVIEDDSAEESSSSLNQKHRRIICCTQTEALLDSPEIDAKNESTVGAKDEASPETIDTGDMLELAATSPSQASDWENVSNFGDDISLSISSEALKGREDCTSRTKKFIHAETSTINPLVTSSGESSLIELKKIKFKRL